MENIEDGSDLGSPLTSPTITTPARYSTRSAILPNSYPYLPDPDTVMETIKTTSTPGSLLGGPSATTPHNHNTRSGRTATLRPVSTTNRRRGLRSSPTRLRSSSPDLRSSYSGKTAKLRPSSASLRPPPSFITSIHDGTSSSPPGPVAQGATSKDAPVTKFGWLGKWTAADEALHDKLFAGWTDEEYCKLCIDVAENHIDWDAFWKHVDEEMINNTLQTHQTQTIGGAEQSHNHIGAHENSAGVSGVNEKVPPVAEDAFMLDEEFAAVNQELAPLPSEATSLDEDATSLYIEAAPLSSDVGHPVAETPSHLQDLNNEEFAAKTLPNDFDGRIDEGCPMELDSDDDEVTVVQTFAAQPIPPTARVLPVYQASSIKPTAVKEPKSISTPLKSTCEKEAASTMTVFKGEEHIRQQDLTKDLDILRGLTTGSHWNWGDASRNIMVQPTQAATAQTFAALSRRNAFVSSLGTYDAAKNASQSPVDPYLFHNSLKNLSMKSPTPKAAKGKGITRPKRAPKSCLPPPASGLPPPLSLTPAAKVPLLDVPVRGLPPPPPPPGAAVHFFNSTIGTSTSQQNLPMNSRPQNTPFEVVTVAFKGSDSARTATIALQNSASREGRRGLEVVECNDPSNGVVLKVYGPANTNFREFVQKRLPFGRVIHTGM